MHCVVLQDDPEWELRRSIEILGYYHTKGEVVIQKVLSVKTKGVVDRDRHRWLHMMHRGNVQCFRMRCGPTAKHPREVVPQGGETVWWSVYREGFAKDKFHKKPNKLVRVKELSAWDSWYDDRSEINLWPSAVPPTQDPFDVSRLIGPYTPHVPPSEYAPFTAWKLGPFVGSGEFLITLLLKFNGATYRRLLQDESRFSVDGPNRLLEAIEFSDLSSLTADEKTRWQTHFEPFRKYMPAKLGYDVILLAPPGGNLVLVQDSSGTVPGPCQPSDGRGRRFITTHQAFQLVLAYAAAGTASVVPGLGNASSMGED